VESPYIHTPLSDGDQLQFRVMILSPGSFKDRLECSVKEVGLSDRPEFEALSYTWQSSKFDTSNTSTTKRKIFNKTKHAEDTDYLLYCDGQIIKIGRGFYNEITRLRFATESRTLWVDQVCIDQGASDHQIRERSQQVDNMRYIYASAKHVLLWTGESDANTLAVFEMIHHMSEFIIDPTVAQQNRLRAIIDDGWRGMEAYALLSEGMSFRGDPATVLQGLSHDSNNILSFIVQFLSRPVFTRVWIVQENLRGEGGSDAVR